jgi:hypothetical protein
VATEVVEDLPAPDDLPDPTELIAEAPLVEAMAKAQEGEDWEPDTLTDLVTIANSLVVLKPGDITPELRETVQTNAASTLEENLDAAAIFAERSDAGVAAAVSNEAEALRDEIEGQLGDWCLLSESDPRRGEAVASADAVLAEEAVFGEPTTTASYIVRDVFILGGKDGCIPLTEESTLGQAWHRIETTFEVKNPRQYAVVTAVKAKAVEVEPGEAPPPPSAEEDASTVSTIMLRNLGNRRLIPAVFTLICLIMFTVFVAQLRHRDKIVKRHLEDAARAGT